MNQANDERPVIYKVNDDGDLANSLARLLRRRGFEAEPFLNPAALLAGFPRDAADDAPVGIVTDVMWTISTDSRLPIACARSIRRYR